MRHVWSAILQWSISVTVLFSASGHKCTVYDQKTVAQTLVPLLQTNK